MCTMEMCFVVFDYDKIFKKEEFLQRKSLTKFIDKYKILKGVF